MKRSLSVGLLLVSFCGIGQTTTAVSTAAGPALVAPAQKVLKPGEEYTDPTTGNKVKNNSIPSELSPGHPQVFVKLGRNGRIEKVIVNSSEGNASVDIDAPSYPFFPVEVWADGCQIEYTGSFNHYLYNYGDNNVWHVHGDKCDLYNGFDGTNNSFWSFGVNNVGHEGAPTGNNSWDNFPPGAPWTMV